MTSPAPPARSEPIIAGVVTSLVGFTSSFVVVVTGLRAVGASPAQAASGLLVLTILFGLGSIALSLHTRRPVTLAWSTPGAALLVSAGASYDAGWTAAVGAFLVVGLLILATGLVPHSANSSAGFRRRSPRPCWPACCSPSASRR